MFKTFKESISPDIYDGWTKEPENSLSLRAETYCHEEIFEIEKHAIFGKTWQWVCHVEKLASPGSFITTNVRDYPLLVCRDLNGKLKAFFNVCKHRGHELLRGEGQNKRITCPYHAWTYNLEGQLIRAPHTENLKNFAIGDVCLESVQVEEFCSFVFVNLDNKASSLKEQSSTLAEEINFWAPDLANLTFAQRLTYNIKSNWKNVVDNFLECYHCPVAHKDFCTLVDMDTYNVTTHGIWSSHMAEAGKEVNSAYSVLDATVKDHAVWWLWPNTCLMRYPGRGNFIVMHIIPVGVDHTFETYDFFFETADPNDSELEAIKYIDEVLQAEDISLVESVQRGMSTPAFTQGRIVHDSDGSGKSEHAVHHFHGLVLDSYREWESHER